MKNFFPPPNLELILQQVDGSHMIPLLNVFSSHNQIKVKGEMAYKTTFITD
jgi:hypothetical protein